MPWCEVCWRLSQHSHARRATSKFVAWEGTKYCSSLPKNNIASWCKWKEAIWSWGYLKIPFLIGSYDYLEIWFWATHPRLAENSCRDIYLYIYILMSFWGQSRVPPRSQTWCWKSITVNPRPRMPVATRTIAFLVGDPYQPSLFHWNPGWKADPRCIFLDASLFTPWSIWFWWPKSIQCTYCWWLASWCSSNPVIYSVLYIPGGVGFLPTVGGYTTQLSEKLIALHAQSRRCIFRRFFSFFFSCLAFPNFP